MKKASKQLSFAQKVIPIAYRKVQKLDNQDQANVQAVFCAAMQHQPETGIVAGVFPERP